jgi:hypothetical protein
MRSLNQYDDSQARADPLRCGEAKIMSSVRAHNRHLGRAAAWTLVGTVALFSGLAGCKQDVTPIERTLLVIESEAIPAEQHLTHLHVVGLVEGSNDEPVILLEPDNQLPWFQLSPAAPPLHEKNYFIDISEFLAREEFTGGDVHIGVKAYHWPNTTLERQEIAGGELVIPHGLTGTVWIQLTRDDLAAVPVASCVPELEVCDSVDNDCDGETDEGIDEVEICDGIDNDCDGAVDEEVSCDDGIPCTEDACDPELGTCVNAEPQGEQRCDDGDPCTVDSCDPSVGCRSIIDTLVCKGCETDAGCENENSCVNVSCNACSGSACPAGFPARCEASDLDEASCSDGDICTQGDTCKGGACFAGAAKVCDDGIPCTTSSCSPETGECSFTATNSLCDDGVECTEDICSLELGGCSVNLGDACSCQTANDCPDDLNPCTSTGCVAGNCVTQYKGDDVVCELSGADCVNGAKCNGEGVCAADTFKPVGTPCDDGSLCTTNDTCSGVGGVCQGVTPHESCNGLDDDCDDKFDEGIETVGEPCDGEDLDLCIGGTLGCTQEGVIVCQGDDSNAIEELQCDGSDEDCDGLIDETFTQKGTPCEEGGSVEAGAGCSVWTCDPNDSFNMLCSPLSVLSEGEKEANGVPVGSPELCNGIDDNCNGEIDEDPEDLELGQECGVGSCSGGENLCNPSGQVVCSTVGEQQPEAPWGCNDKDDDCDGSIDEHAQDEFCDGEDNDCDGVVDNVDGSGDECVNSNEFGECAGIWDCYEGDEALVCVGGIPIKEECSGVDDDCDGQIDEGNVCGENEICEIVPQLVEGMGGKGGMDGMPGEPQLDFMALTSDGSGSVWASVTVHHENPMDPQNPIPPAYELRHYMFDGLNGLSPGTALWSDSASQLLAYDDWSGVLMTYDNNAGVLNVFDTWSDQGGSPLTVGGPGPLAAHPSKLLPIDYDYDWNGLDFLIMVEGMIGGGSAQSFPGGESYLWPPTDLEDPPSGALPWSTGELTAVAYTGKDLLALSKGVLHVCAPDSFYSQQLPSMCVNHLLPAQLAAANTIVVDSNSASYELQSQYVLVANLEFNPAVIYRVNLAKLGSPGGWKPMAISGPPATVITHLSMFDGIGWALDSSNTVTAFDVIKGLPLATALLPNPLVEVRELCAGKGTAFLAMSEPPSFGALQLVCQ